MRLHTTLRGTTPRSACTWHRHYGHSTRAALGGALQSLWSPVTSESVLAGPTASSAAVLARGMGGDGRRADRGAASRALSAAAPVARDMAAADDSDSSDTAPVAIPASGLGETWDNCRVDTAESVRSVLTEERFGDALEAVRTVRRDPSRPVLQSAQAMAGLAADGTIADIVAGCVRARLHNEGWSILRECRDAFETLQRFDTPAVSAVTRDADTAPAANALAGPGPTEWLIPLGDVDYLCQMFASAEQPTRAFELLRTLLAAGVRSESADTVDYCVASLPSRKAWELYSLNVDAVAPLTNALRAQAEAADAQANRRGRRMGTNVHTTDIARRPQRATLSSLHPAISAASAEALAGKLVHAGMMAEAAKLAGDVSQWWPPATVPDSGRFYDKIITKCAREGNLAEAFEVLGWCDYIGRKASTESFAAIQTALCRAGMYEQALAFDSRRAAAGVEANQHTASSNAEALAMLGNHSEARHALDEMLKADVAPTARAVQALVTALTDAGDLHSAVDVLGELRAHGMPVSEKHVHQIVLCAMSQADWVVARALVAGLEARGVKIPPHIFQIDTRVNPNDTSIPDLSKVTPSDDVGSRQGPVSAGAAADIAPGRGSGSTVP